MLAQNTEDMIPLTCCCYLSHHLLADLIRWL